MGRKPLMVKISRRIVYAMKAISFFTLRSYNLINNNIVEMEDGLDESEV